MRVVSVNLGTISGREMVVLESTRDAISSVDKDSRTLATDKIVVDCSSIVHEHEFPLGRCGL